jgi:hypothetical protein
MEKVLYILAATFESREFVMKLFPTALSYVTLDETCERAAGAKIS